MFTIKDIVSWRFVIIYSHLVATWLVSTTWLIPVHGLIQV